MKNQLLVLGTHGIQGTVTATERNRTSAWYGRGGDLLRRRHPPDHRFRRPLRQPLLLVQLPDLAQAERIDAAIQGADVDLLLIHTRCRGRLPGQNQRPRNMAGPFVDRIQGRSHNDHRQILIGNDRVTGLVEAAEQHGPPLLPRFGIEGCRNTGRRQDEHHVLVDRHVAHLVARGIERRLAPPRPLQTEATELLLGRQQFLGGVALGERGIRAGEQHRTRYDQSNPNTHRHPTTHRVAFVALRNHPLKIEMRRISVSQRHRVASTVRHGKMRKHQSARVPIRLAESATCYPIRKSIRQKEHSRSCSRCRRDSLPLSPSTVDSGDGAPTAACRICDDPLGLYGQPVSRMSTLG